MYFVKWTGYQIPTKEPREHIKETEAFEKWTTKTAYVRKANGELKLN